VGILVQDLAEFVKHIQAEYGIRVEDLCVVAHSVGAVIAAAWVHDYAPPIAGLVLATPAFEVKLYVPLAIPLLRLKEKLFGGGVVKSYVRAKMLTHDAEQAKAYDEDPLIFRQIAVNLLLDLHDTSKRLLADAGAITCPVLILSAGSDWVVKNSPQKKFFDHLGSSAKKLEELPGFHHSIFHETDRSLVVKKVRDFLMESFSRDEVRASLLEADRTGYIRAEYDRLRYRSVNPAFGLIAAAMKTVGRLSHGIGLGWKSGFDSGQTLDYVYENAARGVSFLGRLIDRAYLNSIGWRGIRVRKEHLQQTLRAAMQKMRREGRPVRVLDIASGPGRYVLETVRDLPDLEPTALLRDSKIENVEKASALAAQFGLTNVTVEIGDAFDLNSLASIRPRPSVAIVSGLYELFPANGPVLASLQGLAAALEPGGYLIYTNQPWHPQLEFIARVLRNREGRPWIMRRRTQAEMDELVRAAGFEKMEQKVDRWGIFTVSLARRVEMETKGPRL
jgi:esterase/lipase/SAM-dependent methyltransferase